MDGLLDLCTVDLSAVFLDVAKDRLYNLAPDDHARRSAQTVLWQALHDLVIAAGPALVHTAEEVWQSHPGLLAEAESVHLAEWPARQPDPASEEEWEFLLGIRTAVNAAIEPLRASKQLATTLEAEVTLTADTSVVARLAHYRDELVSFLLVARAQVIEEGGRHVLGVEVTRTTLRKCERCWTHRPDVRADGPDAGLCDRCTGVLAAKR
jgi:isoleucyl-tRNA synthetase